MKVAFLILVWNVAVMILDDTGYQPMNCRLWGQYKTYSLCVGIVCMVMAWVEDCHPVDNLIHRDSIHLVPQTPRTNNLYVVTSAEICAAFPVSFIVLMFQVPNKVVVLGVGSGVGLVASFRLIPRCVIRVSEKTFPWFKTDVILCLLDMVSVVSFTQLVGRFRVLGRLSWLP